MVCIGLIHNDCGGKYVAVRREYVNDDYPDVDVYRCDTCGQETMQPDTDYGPMVAYMLDKLDELPE